MNEPVFCSFENFTDKDVKELIKPIIFYNKKYMITYKIIYDITQDAYNWFNSINNFGGMKKIRDPKDVKIAT